MGIVQVPYATVAVTYVRALSYDLFSYDVYSYGLYSHRLYIMACISVALSMVSLVSDM